MDFRCMECILAHQFFYKLYIPKSFFVQRHVQDQLGYFNGRLFFRSMVHYMISGRLLLPKEVYFDTLTVQK